MSSLQQLKRGNSEKGHSDKVVVAVKPSKQISKTALDWALKHVTRPGGFITLLIVVPPHSSGRKLWGFPRFGGDCGGYSKSHPGTTLKQKTDINESCSQMIMKLRDVYDPRKININRKIVSGSTCGAVAAESKRTHASWVVLDKQLRDEEKHCMEELQCNIVVMKRSQPKVLRLNLGGPPKEELNVKFSPKLDDKSSEHALNNDFKNPQSSVRGPTVTPNSSPEAESSFTATEVGTFSVSSSDPGTSPFCVTGMNSGFKENKKLSGKVLPSSDITSSDSDSECPSPSSTEIPSWMVGVLSSSCPPSGELENLSRSFGTQVHVSAAKDLLEKLVKLDNGVGKVSLSFRAEPCISRNVREAFSLGKNSFPGPPPLCSICQHKAPVFGKPPRWFSYSELELATGGFSQANFLAEGGFGSVHRGVLPDGQAIAVKQHKPASSQGDQEFCSEVEVLSCAQHRNVVMLIGFCVEDRRRLLVYEYICNGSLDSHLYGRNKEPLEWPARQKIAVGAARGLRYLHEECRVGCIVHRDMRPNNILLTHDFEPLVGDFGLARWQPDGDLGVETRVIGTIGYLAPEYAQSGQITEKTDVYSFGVVLVELVTGRKAVDINRPKGQQCLAEWARPLLEEYAINELIDPQLKNQYSENEVYCMQHAASLCIRRDPNARPRMSQVLRILDGGGDLGFK